MAKRQDVQVINHGSIVLLDLLSRRAQEWVNANVTHDEVMFFGGALVVEPRYVQDVLNGMAQDGLRVR